jgi:hypothetical protein
MQLTEHQKNLVRAHYGDGFNMDVVEAGIAEGLYEIDFDGIQQDHPEVTA